METYVVGFKIFDAKALATQDGAPCDPYIIIECCGKQESTDILEARQQLASFNKSTTWPDLKLFPAQFESGSIVFSVYARNWFTRNYLIGQASLQLSYINKRQHHLYARRWLCLRQDGSSNITGMLNVSVYALRPGEQAPSATLQEQEETPEVPEENAGQTDDADMLSKAVLKATVEAPPGKAHHLEINVHRVQDLALVPGTLQAEIEPSPYVTVEFAGTLLKTAERENVVSCTFNTKMQIPVVTPVYEDTIILKLWNKRNLAADDLMATGLISFSELRNNALAPQWFNLYGWSPKEIPDITVLTDQGVDPEPNYFMGRLLVSGRVEPLDDEEDLEPAGVGMSRSVAEPNVRMVVLLADVYIVLGAPGRMCEVELSFGSTRESTTKVAMDVAGSRASAAIADDEDDEQEEVEVHSFTFKEKDGRIKQMLVMNPEEEESQPFVMLSVYTYDYMGNRTRIAYAKKRVREFPLYEPGNPSKPKFIPLKLMPGASSPDPVSVLVTIERTPSEDNVRHARKFIKPMQYVVRTYAFMARQIPDVEGEGDTFALKTAVSGRGRETAFLQGPRPRWMTSFDIDVTLFSDSAKAPPVMEPIALDVIRHRGGRTDVIGAATCVYTHMRQKDNLGNWEPYALQPQWIKMKGGKYQNSVTAEVLVCFELLHAKFKQDRDLAPRSMMPQREDVFNAAEHFCRMRKATLHFSLLSLRDLIPRAVGPTTANISKPVVEVQVAWGDLNADDEEHTVASEKIVFEYMDVVPGGDKRIRQDQLENWQCDVRKGLKGTNFDFLQVKKLKVLIPDKMILQPYVRVRVFESEGLDKAYLGGLSSFGYKFRHIFIGECRRSLGHMLPCSWFKGISKTKSLEEQKDLLKQEVEKARKEAKVREEFEQPTDEELKRMRKEMKKEKGSKKEDNGADALKAALESQEKAAEEYINSMALPRELREAMSKRELEGSARLNIKPVQSVNTQIAGNFGEREGDKLALIGANASKTIAGKMEDQPPDGELFKNDFWYKSFPLQQNQDVILSEDPVDWTCDPKVVGFVKCCFKLVDGWEGEREHEFMESEAPKLSTGEGSHLTKAKGTMSDAAALPTAGDGQYHARINRSFGLDDLLDEYAFDEKKMRARFKGPEHMPSRIRVRLYIVKAVCIFGSQKASGYPDPYVEFSLGCNPANLVSYKNSAKINTAEPDFYLMEERDIVLPVDNRLEVRIYDKGSGFAGDVLIGGTVIDLEDRWHSKSWRKENDRQQVPKENRPMYTHEELGKNRGTIEMWVEMLDTQRAMDCPAAPLVKPPEIELEIRMVIWDTKNVRPIGKNEYVNVQLVSTLDCGEYFGMQPKRQETDVHYNSKDGSAIFNWRVVYSRIKMPIKTCSVKMDLMHHELTSDTPIGSLDLDLKKYVERVAQNMDAIELVEDWLKFTNPETAEPDEDIGQAKVQLFVLTQIEATSKRAGVGREDPNDYPPLITPAEGRDWGDYFGGAWKLPEFGMWKKMLPLFIIMLIFLFFVIIMKQMGLL